jgi:hypothetical protein
VTTTEREKLTVGEDGPFAICADTVNRKIYFLCYDKGSVTNAVIFVIDMDTNTVSDRITLEDCMFTITPYGGNIMINYIYDKLLVVSEGKIIVIDPVAKTIETLNGHKTIEYAAYSPSTGNIYAISKEEEDEMTASLYHYCLYCITPYQQKQQFLNSDRRLK